MIILGLSGNAGVGKDTVADYLVAHYGYTKFAFSDQLYNEVQQAYGLEDQDLLRNRETKEVTVDRLQLDRCADEGFVEAASAPGLIPEVVTYLSQFNQPLSPRQVLQWWGTEYRRAQDPNYWLKACERWLDSYMSYYPEQRPQHFVNTTVRFPNEQEWVRGYCSLTRQDWVTGGGTWQGNVWHIHREGITSVNPHVSETPLPVLTGERELWNNDTIERLHKGIDLLMHTQAEFVKVEPMIPDLLRAATEGTF